MALELTPVHPHEPGPDVTSSSSGVSPDLAGLGRGGGGGGRLPRVGRHGVRDLPLDLGHLLLAQTVRALVVELQTLLRRETVATTFDLAAKKENLSSWSRGKYVLDKNTYIL